LAARIASVYETGGSWFESNRAHSHTRAWKAGCKGFEAEARCFVRDERLEDFMTESNLLVRNESFIDGAWRAPDGSGRIEITNGSTEEILGVVPFLH
jgi:hypothetical protein